jgi:hypothetical protein
MSGRFKTFFRILLGLVLVGSLCAEVGMAQKRKRRTRRTAKPVAPRPVIQNPTIAPPGESTDEIKIVSTADEGPVQDPAAEKSNTKTSKSSTSGQSSEDVQRTITTLSNQVNKLNEKLSQIQEEERDEREMESLTRLEQRAEQLRSQLIDAQVKMVEYSLRPENIDKITQTSGSVRPEEVRETRKRQLENERSRIDAQLKILETGKTRLEVSLASADSQVDMLRSKIEQRRINSDNTQKPEAAKPRKPDDPF